jgi:hypothetical protein
MSAARDRKDEAAINARLLAHARAEWEGRVCACEHLQPDHWDAGVGKCGVADCGCTAYDEDTFGAELKRVKEQHPVNQQSHWQPPGKKNQNMRSALRALGGDPGDLA